MLAAVLWWARLFFLESVFKAQPRDQDEVGVEAVLIFQKQHAAWMCVGIHTVISTIIGWMAYGNGNRQKMGGQPSIRLADDGKPLFHMGDQLSVEEFTCTLCGQVTEAQKLLDRLFGGSWQKVSGTIDIGRITDNMAGKGDEADGSIDMGRGTEQVEEAEGADMATRLEAAPRDAARARAYMERAPRQGTGGGDATALRLVAADPEYICTRRAGHDCHRPRQDEGDPGQQPESGAVRARSDRADDHSIPIMVDPGRTGAAAGVQACRAARRSVGVHVAGWQLAGMEYRTAQKEARARDAGQHGREDRGGTVPGDRCGDGPEDLRTCDEAAG
ncbi:uncharacterized protein BKA55DRAFT_544305 [Fusarium redolens]|uniref:Uncharacterized protein n=1 Tax=Fusarium redolens TaxID=48865 RepID=A0A9P9G9M0_FUSRE|nr:uncharacterized protein BKA55DRAFT_544305 [Fusarium redolens]KAH7233814.1 hypothetical protein BKA55DRAFT_544305 [Fusarium redolens]